MKREEDTHAPTSSPRAASAPRAGAELDGRTVLQLGSGRKYRSDAVNVDLVGDTGADVVHDLDRLPWPFESDRFSEVVAYDVIEHLADVLKAFEEIHRVCRDGAVVRVTVPHFSCANAYTDPTHRHAFGYFTTDYFTGDTELSYYTSAKFRLLSRELVFEPSVVNKAVWRLARRWPKAYEMRWAWIFPAWYLHFELAVVKPRPGG